MADDLLFYDGKAAMHQDVAVDLSGIGAISAAAVAAIGIPAALMVGRWTMRGALAQAEGTYLAALATASSNHDHWRRGVQRDACVQFLVITAELDRLSTPMDQAASHDEIEAAHTAADEVLHRATTAYYVVRLESSELGEVANELLETGRRYAIGGLRWGAAERARATLNLFEEEAGSRLTHVWDALHRLGEAHDAANRQRGRGADYWEARGHARRILGGLGGLTDEQIHDLLNDAENPVDIIQLIERFHAARESFLEAAHSRLNAPVTTPDPESRSLRAVTASPRTSRDGA
ncbi:hypothetical protein [Streptomyces sp. NPDC001315]|uniref:hypothetical protein n=1 Tax=Streptomyces sp. NPDC001315 TaxID=3364562 RepID=UPI003679808E